MADRPRRRGPLRLLGFVLLVAGVVGSVLLFVGSMQRPDSAVDGFARAPVGCTTTLDFTETGTFFVYVERDSPFEVDGDECVPVADGFVEFAFTVDGDAGQVPTRRDDSIEYDDGTHEGQSVARIEIETAGQYQIVVRGDDPNTVAAIGRDPEDGVTALRVAALITGVGGVLLGALLIVASRRRVQPSPTSTAAAPGTWPPAPPMLPPATPLAPGASLPPPVAAPDAAVGRGPSPWAPPSPPTVAGSEPSHDGDDPAEDGDLVG